MEPNRQKTIEVHLPEPSYWPIVLALGLVLVAMGVIFQWIISLVGLLVTLVAILGWTLENRKRFPIETEETHE